MHIIQLAILNHTNLNIVFWMKVENAAFLTDGQEEVASISSFVDNTM